MLIKQKGKSQLVDVVTKGDIQIFKHMQDNRPIIKQCAEIRKEFNPAFTRNRPAWPVASIPALVWYSHPEFKNEDGTINWKSFDKWLNTEQGRVFKTGKK